MNKNSGANLPNSGVNNMPSDARREITTTVLELSKRGKITAQYNTPNELQTRIDEYFEFCADTGAPLGIETLCVALGGITRQTFWKWCNGVNCSEQWQEICVSAKQTIISFIELAEMTGRLNPSSAIFMKKNLALYTDNYEITSALNVQEERPSLSLEDIRRELLATTKEEQETNVVSLSDISQSIQEVNTVEM